MEKNLYNASWFLIKNDTNPQFTYREKVPVAIKLKNYQQYFQCLFDGVYSEDNVIFIKNTFLKFFAFK